MAVVVIGAVVRAPRVSCSSLDSNACVRAADAVVVKVGGREIARIGLVGYRGCFPGPIYCPLIPNEIRGPLSAVAGLEYSDGSRAAFNVWELDPGSRPSVSPMQDDLVEYSLALVFPKR